MSKILALWSTPRSRSTAFMTMMSQRKDYVCFMEPFMRSAFFGTDRIFNRYQKQKKKVMYKYSFVLDDLLKKALEKKVFIKDHGCYVEHLADQTFLSHFEHTFLIRDPAQSLPSLHNKWPDVTFEEAGYQGLADLFDKVTEHTGKIPPLIDADDLIHHTEATIQKYCFSVGIPFIEESLEWSSGEPDAGGWHEHLNQSTKFQENKNRNYASIEETPELQQLYDQCRPLYERLKQHKMSVEDQDAG